MTHYGFQSTYPDVMMKDEAYSKHMEYELKERAIRELVEQIGDGERYVVRIFPVRNLHLDPYLFPGSSTLRYDWEVTKVQTETYKIVEPPDYYGGLMWSDLSFTAVDEIKKRIKNKWKSFWSKKK